MSKGATGEVLLSHLRDAAQVNPLTGAQLGPSITIGMPIGFARKCSPVYMQVLSVPRDHPSPVLARSALQQRGQA